MSNDYKLTLQEQETIINGNSASKEWDILTSDSRIIRRMDRQGFKPDGRSNPWGYVSYTIPFDKISILKAGNRVKPQFTPEQLERKRVALALARKALTNNQGKKTGIVRSMDTRMMRESL